jgi:hypothetical protein
MDNRAGRGVRCARRTRQTGSRRVRRMCWNAGGTAARLPMRDGEDRTCGGGSRSKAAVCHVGCRMEYVLLDVCERARTGAERARSTHGRVRTRVCHACAGAVGRGVVGVDVFMAAIGDGRGWQHAVWSNGRGTPSRRGRNTLE